MEQIAFAQLKQAPNVAIKVLSEDISHKSDVGGVHLGLASPAEARAAAEAMTAARGEGAPRCAAARLHRAADDRVAERA